MIQLPCPNCGPRNVAEFRYVGERQVRPDPDAADPRAWRAYLYLRTNPAGWTDETWLHRAGCWRFLVVERHTVTNEIRSVREAAGDVPGTGTRALAGGRGRDGAPGGPA